jgi:VWFA-related protein
MTRTLGVMICLILVSVLAADNVSSQRQGQTFRSGVDLIEVDVIVTDRRGKPVLGLARSDFEIFEDGQPVEIASFQAIALEEVDTRPSPFVSGDSNSLLGSNEASLDGRLFVLLLDDAGIRFSAGRLQRVKQIGNLFVERLGATHQAALMLTSGRSALQVEFTADKRRLLAAVDKLVVGEITTGEKLLDVLTRVARQLEAINQRRKIIVLISEGEIGIDTSAIIGKENIIPKLRAFARAAQRANVAVYPFNPGYAANIDGMVHAETAADRADQIERDGASTRDLQVLAETTGGLATVRTNLFGDASLDGWTRVATPLIEFAYESG